jgi:hypothetical protein
MSIRRSALIAVAFAAIASAASAAPRLTVQGWGKLRVGMRERDAVRLFHLRVPTNDGIDSFDCRQDEMPSQPGLYVMAERGLVTRITIDGDSRLRTDRGLGLSSTEEEVRRTYGPRLAITTAPYMEEPAHELIFWNARHTRGVRYDTDAAGAVIAIYVGSGSIIYIEGCS